MLSLTGHNVTHAGTIDVNDGTLGAGIHESLSTVADVHVTSGATLLMEDTQGWGGLVQALHRVAARMEGTGCQKLLRAVYIRRGRVCPQIRGAAPAGVNGAWPETLVARPRRLNGAESDDNTRSVLPCEGPFERSLSQSTRGKGRCGRSGARRCGQLWRH